MEVNRITVLKSFSPIVLKDKPSDQTIEIVSKLSTNAQFLQIRDLMRRVYHVPKDGLSLHVQTDSKDLQLPTEQAESIFYTLLWSASILRGKVDLADDFLPQMLLLFFYNAIIDFEDFKGFVSRPIRFLAGRSTVASAMCGLPYEAGVIIIPYAITKNKFKQWIKDNWDQVEKGLESLPDDPAGSRIHAKWLIALEIMDLRDRLGLSFSKVSDEMYNRYPDYEQLADEAYVRKIYFDYKKLIEDWTQFSTDPVPKS